MELMQILLNFSEKAGHIARAIRQEPKLFSLLIEEKDESEKNKRFDHDFKTLADVLIQECLKHYLLQEFPEMCDHVFGEENNEFTNTLGEKITVKICESSNDTAALLTKVLNENFEAASILSDIVHSSVSTNSDIIVDADYSDLCHNDIGIWIDPIDSTSEYIKGLEGKEYLSIYQYGLQCVTVLIGLYDRISGLPIGGLVNQPFSFYDKASLCWNGKIYWGLCSSKSKISNIVASKNSLTGNIVVSSSEDSVLQEKLKRNFRVIHATASGYKSLAVAMNLVDAYICSKGSTYRWDTNASHGILRAVGGGMIAFKDLRNIYSIKEEDLLNFQIKYNAPNCEMSTTWQNSDGLIAYRHPEVLLQILDCFS